MEKGDFHLLAHVGFVISFLIFKTCCYWCSYLFQWDCAFKITLELMRELSTLVSWLTIYLVYKWSFPLFLFTLVCLVVPTWTLSWITAAGSTAKAAGSPRRSSASQHHRIWAPMGTASTGPCRGDLPLSWATPHLQASRPPRAQPGSASSKSRPCDFQRHSEKEKVMKEWKKRTSPRPVPAVSSKRAVLKTGGHCREDRWPGSIAEGRQSREPTVAVSCMYCRYGQIRCISYSF